MLDRVGHIIGAALLGKQQNQHDDEICQDAPDFRGCHDGSVVNYCKKIIRKLTDDTRNYTGKPILTYG
jgi:hypothetical protein